MPRLSKLLFCLISLLCMASCSEQTAKSGQVPANDSPKADSIPAVAIIHIEMRDETNTIHESCVKFDAGNPVTGLDLLKRSGLSYESGSGLICKIRNRGCPGDDCFCSCKDLDDCKYWVYYHLENGKWKFASEGPADYEVADKSVDAWVWGDSTMKPAVVDFGKPCNN